MFKVKTGLNVAGILSRFKKSKNQSFFTERAALASY